MVLAIGLTAMVAGLALLVEHWFPWEMLLRRPLPKLAAYVLGVLGLILPLTGLLAVWGAWWSLAAVWATVLAGGGGVLIGYGVDWWLRRMAQGEELREQVKLRDRLEERDERPVEGKAHKEP
jgi:uncharacterized membrane protein